MSKKRNILIALIFVAAIIMIPAVSLLKMVKQSIPISQYTGALVGRYAMIRLNTGLTEKVTGGTYMESNEVLLGKDGWLFYKVETDGTPLLDYMGLNRFDEDELAKALGNMEKFGDNMAEKGIRFAVMTIPNKEQLYSEYMPETVPVINDESRLDELSTYVEKETGDMIAGKYPYIDMTDRLSAMRDTYPLYYKTDTHWTEEGSFIALQEMMSRLYGKSESIEDVSFVSYPGFIGDLTKISGTMDRFADVTYELQDESVTDEYRRDETLFVIGDSFGDAMLHVAEHYYKEVYWVRISDYRSGLLEEYKPDVVLWECVERYLPDMVEEID